MKNIAFILILLSLDAHILVAQTRFLVTKHIKSPDFIEVSENVSVACNCLPGIATYTLQFRNNSDKYIAFGFMITNHDGNKNFENGYILRPHEIAAMIYLDKGKFKCGDRNKHPIYVYVEEFNAKKGRKPLITDREIRFTPNLNWSSTIAFGFNDSRLQFKYISVLDSASGRFYNKLKFYNNTDSVMAIRYVEHLPILAEKCQTKDELVAPIFKSVALTLVPRKWEEVDMDKYCLIEFIDVMVFSLHLQ